MRESNASLKELARRTLVARRSALIAQREASAEGARELLEQPEPDWEDRAANVTTARGLEQLAESERAQLTLVQTALRRLDEGTWGWCVACGNPIAAARLRAMPEALGCAHCNNLH